MAWEPHPASPAEVAEFNSLRFFFEIDPLSAIVGSLPAVARPLLSPLPRSHMLTALTNPLFWNMKIKITILTLATFAALC